MTRKIELNEAIVYTDDVSIYEVYAIEIDEIEKSIECLDIANHIIAMIKYDLSVGPVEYINHHDDGTICEHSDTIVNSNGKVVI